MATLTSFRPAPVRSFTRGTTEPQLFYAPPYASPEHDTLAWALVRHLNPAAALREVKHGGHASFMIEMEGRSVCIELVEDTMEAGECAADASGTINYQICRSDVAERLSDCLYVMSLLDPTIFSPRDRVRLRRDASENLAVELSGDRMSEIVLRYELPDQLVQIEDELVVIDPDAAAFMTVMRRLDG